MIGRAEPVDGRTGGTALLALGRIGHWGASTASLQRGVRARVMPRLSDQLSTLVRQSLTAPEVDPDAPLEVVTTAEWRTELVHGSARGTIRLRSVEIAHTVSAQGGLLSRFTPAGYAFLPASAFDRTVRVRSIHAEWDTPLLLGLRVDGQAAVRSSDPGWRDELWMTPFDARVRLSGARRFFRERLALLAYVRGAWNGRRATPYGLLDPHDRYDAGLEGSIEDFRFFFEMANLEDDVTEAAGYDGGWMVLPYRSFRMGLVWRFTD